VLVKIETHLWYCILIFENVGIDMQRVHGEHKIGVKFSEVKYRKEKW
jgi:hypothetical protein